MAQTIKLPKGSTYINRGIVKWDNEQGCFVVGNRLNFVIPKDITERLYSSALGYYESGGLLFFELLKTPPRTLVVKELLKVKNISSNRARKRKLFLPAFYHIHPVSREYSNIQRDFYRQAGPSQNDIACTFYTYPYLKDGKLSLPEFVICRHPTENWMFFGYYDSIRLEAIDVQRNFFQQELGLELIKGTAPSIHSFKKELKNMDALTLVGGAMLCYFGYKAFEPQIQKMMNDLGDLVSAELNLKLIETQTAAYSQVPLYSIVRPGGGCLVTLPRKGYQKRITTSASQPRVLKKLFREIKKLLR
jgi:hypothetical protein